MRLLLDAQVFLLWLADDPRLGKAARKAIAGPQALVHVSAAVIWEISIKAALGKIDLDGADLVAEIGENGFLELPIAGHHARAAGALPRHHDDPFDRMLIAQAQLEGLTLVSRERGLRDYEVSLLWA